MQDKTIILIIFIICILLVASMAAFIAWILFAYQKKNNTFQAQLEIIRDNNEKELLKSQLEMQEQTFQYISQEIHDNVGQFISLAKLHMNTINLDDKISARNQLEHSTELLGRALDDLRDLSKSLSSELIKNAGLVKAVELQVSQLQKTGKYRIIFEVHGNYGYMEEQKEIILFRIMQEAINNIVRHSFAGEIDIILSFFDDYLLTRIHDNGKGFNPSAIFNNPGGVNNMKKRARLINADFKIESSAEKGTAITINAPYK